MSWLSTSDVSSIKAPAAEKRTCKKMGATHRVALREGKPTQNPATLQKRTANGAEVYVRVTLKRTTGLGQTTADQKKSAVCQSAALFPPGFCFRPARPLSGSNPFPSCWRKLSSLPREGPGSGRGSAPG